MNAVIREVIKVESNMVQKVSEKLGLKVNVRERKSISEDIITPDVEKELKKIKEKRKRNGIAEK